MEGTIVARSYASALHDIGERNGVADRFGEELQRLAELIRQEPRVRQFIEAPTVEVADKKSVLRSALGAEFHPLLVNFVLVVVNKRRQRLLGEIAREYQTIRDDTKGHLRAEITLAREPDERLEEEISSTLSRRLGRLLIPHFRVDPKILGGIRVRYEDRVIDGTLRRRLIAMRRAMLSAELMR
ncbi:MAG: ATP synthase F1 subunit delta [Gemmatimonadota bacterium]